DGDLADRVALARHLVERGRQRGAVLRRRVVHAVLARIVRIEIARPALSHDAGEVAAIVVHQPRGPAERILDRRQEAALVEAEVSRHTASGNARVGAAACARSRGRSKGLRDESSYRVVRLLENARTAEMSLRL